MKKTDKKKIMQDEDQATIFAESAHIRNRDEIMLDGNRTIQGGASTDIDDDWDPADRDRLKGIADQSSEAVDTQLSHLEGITKKSRNSADHHQPTVAKPGAAEDAYEQLSDEELLKYADVLGIPDRQHLPRMKLIGMMREQERRGL